MNNNRSIEQILQSLDGIQSAEANPFLATRLRERMKQAEKPLLSGRWGWRLAAVMTVVVVMNLITIKQLSNRNDNVSGAAIVREYSITLPDTY
jgi:hypothetical protein